MKESITREVFLPKQVAGVIGMAQERNEGRGLAYAMDENVVSQEKRDFANE